MSKENAKKATFKDLIAKKLKKEEVKFKTKDIYVRSMDATLTFTNPSDDLIVDIMDQIGEGKETGKMVAAFKNLIYLCCDMLQDTELHKEIEATDPFDTVDKIFDLVDVLEIGSELMDSIDIDGKIKELKN